MPRGFQGEICVYCHERPSTRVGDHVIASGFMPGTKWSVEYPPVRVPACEPCQKSWHDDEQYIMSLLPLDVHSTHPAVKEVIEGQITRSLQSDNKYSRRNWDRIRKDMNPINVATPDGLFIFPTQAIKPEYSALSRVVSKITKGLFYHHLHQRFPLDYEVAVFNVDHATSSQHLATMERIGFNGPFEIGNRVFTYIYSYSDSDTAKTMWIMELYNGQYFNVLTQAPINEGDVLELTKELHHLKPSRYIVLKRTVELVTLCYAASDLSGNLCPSPLKEQIVPSVSSAFRVIGHIGL